MKTYRIEIGLYTYSVKADNLKDAKKLAAYKHKEKGRGRGATATKLAKYLATKH